MRRCVSMWRLYAGELTRGSVKDGVGTEVIVHDAWAPIIALEKIVQVAEILDRRGANRRGVPAEAHPKNPFELAGLLYCSRCKKMLEGQTTRHGKRKYRHRPKGDCPSGSGQGDADEIEGAVRDRLALFALPKELDVRLEASAYEAVQRNGQREGGDEAARIVLLERRLKRMTWTFEVTEHEDEEAAKREYLAKIGPVKEEIRELKGRVNGNGAAVQVAQVVERLRQLDDLVRRAQASRRHELLASFFERVEVDLDTGRIEYWPQAWSEPFF